MACARFSSGFYEKWVCQAAFLTVSINFLNVPPTGCFYSTLGRSQVAYLYADFSREPHLISLLTAIHDYSGFCHPDTTHIFRVRYLENSRKLPLALIGRSTYFLSKKPLSHTWCQILQSVGVRDSEWICWDTRRYSGWTAKPSLD